MAVREFDRPFIGLWLPRRILFEDSLTTQEKLVLAEIVGLSRLEHGCIASNQYFADFLGLGKERARAVIYSIGKKGFVKTKLIYNEKREVVRRILIPLVQLDDEEEKVIKKKYANHEVDEPDKKEEKPPVCEDSIPAQKEENKPENPTCKSDEIIPKDSVPKETHPMFSPLCCDSFHPCFLDNQYIIQLYNTFIYNIIYSRVGEKVTEYPFLPTLEGVGCPVENQRDMREYPTEKIPYDKIIDYMNKRLGTKYKSTTRKTQACIKARWNEGFRQDDFERVIDNMATRWTGSKWEQYLRPETLFSPKFEGYLNTKVAVPTRNPLCDVERGNPDDYDLEF